VIPPDASAAFVADMEDVLEVYHRPRDPARPLVCLDETSKQLIVETRTPILAKCEWRSKSIQNLATRKNWHGICGGFSRFLPSNAWWQAKAG
jgi:hypothetical protein